MYGCVVDSGAAGVEAILNVPNVYELYKYMGAP